MRMVCIGCSFSLSHQTVIQTSIKLQTPSLMSPLQIFHVGSSASGTRLPFISPWKCWEGPLILEILKQSHPPAFQQCHGFTTQGLGIDIFLPEKVSPGSLENLDATGFTQLNTGHSLSLKLSSYSEKRKTNQGKCLEADRAPISPPKSSMYHLKHPLNVMLI